LGYGGMGFEVPQGFEDPPLGGVEAPTVNESDDEEEDEADDDKEAQMTKPASMIEPSLTHSTVSPAVMWTPTGPLVPEYWLPWPLFQTVSVSQQLSVAKDVAVRMMSNRAEIVHRSELP